MNLLMVGQVVLHLEGRAALLTFEPPLVGMLEQMGIVNIPSNFLSTHNTYTKLNTQFFALVSVASQNVRLVRWSGFYFFTT